MIFIKKCLRWTVSEIWAYSTCIYGFNTQTFSGQKKQNLSGPIFFSENIPGVILMRRWAKSDKKSCIIYFFCQTPTLFGPKNGTLRANLRAYRYSHIVIGIMGNLNPEIQEILLNSFWEIYHFMWTHFVFSCIPMYIHNFKQIH